jgi:hypothetical protein
MPTDKDEGLMRLGGGRWQTRDERFTIEPQSGTWAVVDAEQTDELGLPLVRGPYKSLTAAKEAIAGAREAGAPTSTLPTKAPEGRPKAEAGPFKAGTAKVSKDDRGSSTPAKAPPEPAEPRWIRDLEPSDRRRATRLIERLGDAGATDPENLVKRDLVGEVPAVAAFAIGRAIRGLGDDASVGEVVDALVDGRDPDLGVRWRLVDDDGRPIPIDSKALERGGGAGS